MAQRLKRLPALWKTWVRSLGQEDPLEKEMATHSSILVWRIPYTEEPGELQSMGPKELHTTEQLTHTHTHTFSIKFYKCYQLTQGYARCLYHQFNLRVYG